MMLGRIMSKINEEGEELLTQKDAYPFMHLFS
jgi:hypothetical protein